jgi:hypothetical protein
MSRMLQAELATGAESAHSTASYESERSFTNARHHYPQVYDRNSRPSLLLSYNYGVSWLHRNR